MTALNRLLTGAFDLLFRPIEWLPPLAGIAICSLVTAVIMLLVVKATSNQRGMALVKRAIQGDLFEIRLFSDDLGAVFRAQGGMLLHTLAYLRLSLIPTLWMIVPLALLFSHLQFHYGYAGLTPGQPALLTATLGADVRDPAALNGGSAPSLDVPGAIHVDTPAIWFPATREVVWRITPKVQGEFDVWVHAGDQAYAKTVQVSEAAVRRSPIRQQGGFLSQFLYPSESPLPKPAALARISVDYPSREIRVLGWSPPWVVTYLALSLAFAFALRRPFRVVM